MDQTLFQAARDGDVDHLQREFQANPDVLHALVGGKNTLHIACYAGHLNFAATLLNLRPQLARELNQDGFSPLHIAASCGHVEIVKLLIQANPDLCLFTGKDGKIPLHLAVAKGNVEVARELLLSSSDSIECVTAQGENALHVAVNYTQFQVFQLLIQHLKRVNKEDLLNSKDGNGNTVLHLAVFKKQYQAVDLILNGSIISKEKIEVNPLNKSGLTPLDMLLMFQSESGDREIHQILIQTRALKAENLRSRPTHTQEERPRNHHDTRQHQPKYLLRIWNQLFSFNKLDHSPVEVTNTLLVVLVLITAATYQAVLSPPGGVWQDDSLPTKVHNSSSSVTSNSNATRPHTAGQPILLTNNPYYFYVFFIINSLAFCISLSMIFQLTASFPLRETFHVLVTSLMFSYGVGLVGIFCSDEGSLQTGALLLIIIYLFLVLGLPAVTDMFVRAWENRRNASARTSQERV